MQEIKDVLPEDIPSTPGVFTHRDLLQHGADFYNNKQGYLTGFNCPICKNKGYVERVVFEEIYNDYAPLLVECQCMEQRRALKRAKNSGLGIYLEKTFDDYIATERWQKEIKSKAIEYTETVTQSWFAMLGQSGAGKTLICSIIANNLLNQGKDVRYVTWTEFISKLKRDMMAHETERVSNYFDSIKRVEVLYLDEVLKTYNDTDLKYFIELINYRYTNDLKTIISSEKTSKEFLNIDEASLSRIVEKAGLFIFSIKPDQNKNYRLSNAGKSCLEGVREL